MRARKIALLGVMGALAIAVNALEGIFNIPFLPPGAKPGLSNVVSVLAFFVSGATGAVYVTAVKALFALITRGATAFILSLAGGMLSVAVTVLLLKSKKCPFTLVGISVAGAISHNMGQLIASIAVTGTPALINYLPVLLIFAAVSGVVTGLVLTFIKPYTEKIGEKLL